MAFIRGDGALFPLYFVLNIHGYYLFFYGLKQIEYCVSLN